MASILVVDGRGRDLRTGETADQVEVIHEDRLSLSLTPERIVQSCSFDPHISDLSGLLGASIRNGWRQHIEPIIRQDVLRARPVVVLLDDIVGCCTIETWMEVNWGNLGSPTRPFDRSPFENVCTGYATGSPALAILHENTELAFVPPLVDGTDALAFHPLLSDQDRTMRRVRRIDIWREQGTVRVDAMFQDTGVTHGTRRAALHEYRLLVRLVPDSEGRHEVAELEAVHGALPYSECLGAKQNVAGLIGWKLDKLQANVHRELKGPRGCTHLNDALRSLGTIDALVHLLGPEGQ